MLGIDIQVCVAMSIQVCVAMSWHTYLLLHCKLAVSLMPVLAAGYLAFATQDVVLPKEHCDDRVEIMQADARTLNIHELYTKFEVVLQYVQKNYKQKGSGDACV